MRPALELLVDYAEAAAKKYGHESVELRHLLCAVDLSDHDAFVAQFGTLGVDRLAALMSPPGIHFGPIDCDQAVTDLLARADREDGKETVVRELAQVLVVEPPVLPVRTALARNGVDDESSRDTADEQSPASLDGLLAELNALVGLDEVKRQVEEFCQLQRVQALRRDQGLPTIELGKHLVFTGNPGTGKTTVARIVSKIYAAIGIVSDGTFMEATRADLVAPYAGQTPARTAALIKRSLGGVLFIDEAYTLTRSRFATDYGHEAIEELLKQMEDHRKDLAVIVAGYPKPMEEFLASNPGLRSRFGRAVSFPDYAPLELWTIFEQMIEAHDLSLAPEGTPYVQRYLEVVSRTENFGNGRAVRNIFERILGRQALRLAHTEAPAVDDLRALTLDDCRAIEALVIEETDQHMATGQYL